MRFVLIIIAVILGKSLVQHFDFKTLQFAKPGLDSLYAIVFIAAIFLFIRDVKKTDHSNK
ncbi:hypothetical protein GCM10027085_65320 [Spirosoma aerophilum]